MARYQYTNDPNVVYDTQTGFNIPIVGGGGASWDYFQAWLAAGGVPDPYVPPAVTADQARYQRDGLLAKTDWTQLYDAKVPDTTRAAFAAYRQALRDVTSQSGFPANVIWPTPPTYNKATGAYDPYPKYTLPNILVLPSTTEPSSVPAGSAVIYVEDGTPKVKTDTGTVTEFADRGT